MRSAIPISSHHFGHPRIYAERGCTQCVYIYIARRPLPLLLCRLLAAKSLLIWYLWCTFNGLACMSLQVNNSVKRIIARRVQIFCMRNGWGMKIRYTLYCVVAPLQVFVWSKLIVRSDCLDVFVFFFCVCVRGRIASAAWRQQWDFDDEKSNLLANYS